MSNSGSHPQTDDITRSIEWPLWVLPALLFILPTSTVLISYWLSQSHGLVPECFPLVHGCTSVSAAGRYPPASFLFRAGIIPGAVLLMIYWLLIRAWLQSLSPKYHRSQNWLLITGMTGAVFLIVYAVFLGSKGDFYAFMRRTGIVVYFAMTFFAQLLQTRVLLRLSQTTHPELFRLSQWKLRICTLLFVLGVGSIPIMNFIDNKDQLQNVLE
ncbi:MAG: hypothetical protein HKM24_02220 [Gammaproteobacteria bacterium]|nr:hypothetical protein [Gammaproteobacteria bacterium]